MAESSLNTGARNKGDGRDPIALNWKEGRYAFLPTQDFTMSNTFDTMAFADDLERRGFKPHAAKALVEAKVGLQNMLSGISSFPVTPINSFGQLDKKGLAALIERQISAGVSSIGLLGSTGTYMYLSEKIRTDVIKFAKTQIRDRVPMMVGISALSTMDAIRFAQTAKACGATLGLLAPVTYNALSEKEVFEHFSAVARLGGLPICIYDNPSTTHFEFSPELIARLSDVTGIIGIKNSLPVNKPVSEHLNEQRLTVPSSFISGYSGDWGGLDALLAGADTWFSVLAGVFPAVCCKMNVAIKNGDINAAHEINSNLIPIWKLFQKYSSLRVIYEILEYSEMADAVLPKPLLPVSGEAKLEVLQVIDSYPLDYLC